MEVSSSGGSHANKYVCKFTCTLHVADSTGSNIQTRGIESRNANVGAKNKIYENTFIIQLKFLMLINQVK